MTKTGFIPAICVHGDSVCNYACVGKGRGHCTDAVIKVNTDEPLAILPPGAPVVQHVIGEPVEWHYDIPATRGKVQLLTVGGIAVTGVWAGSLGQYYLAWAPLLKRNKEKEAQILANFKGNR